jgi:hypothetical protein
MLHCASVNLAFGILYPSCLWPTTKQSKLNLENESTSRLPYTETRVEIRPRKTVNTEHVQGGTM